MKICKGFVSNSSSSIFIITNKSDKDLSLVQFVLENPQFIEKYNKTYDYKNSQFDLLYSAMKNDIIFPANSIGDQEFADDDNTLVGRVLCYMLEYGEESENFKWEFKEILR